MENQIALSKMYLVTVLSLMLALPVISICINFFTGNHPEVIMSLVGKWFVFWAIGVRLLTAGIKQAIDPAFTAEKIFHITDKGSHIVVKELGFANICFGLIGIISLFIPSWRMAAAFAGGLFLALDGITHVIKKPASLNETIAMISDLFIAMIMAAYIIFYLHN